MRLKGRHWLLLWLLLFIGTAVVVVARQTAAYRLARQLDGHRKERSVLEARRADLDRRIRNASSRQVLELIAEQRLGLHHPSDAEITLLPLDPALAPAGHR